MNREGACYKYYAAVASRFVAWNASVVFTPAPDGVLDELEKISGITVLKRSTPKLLPGYRKETGVEGSEK